MLDSILFGLIDERLAMGTFVLHRHTDILGLGGQPCQSKAQGIGSEFVDHVNRIDPVSFALGHCLAKAIEDLRMDVNLAERHLADVVEPHEHHPCNP